MSQFPALRPSNRNYSPGLKPVTHFASMSGKETRIITGDTATNALLVLTFTNLQEAAANELLTHYQQRSGTFLAFTLPAAVWAGWVSYNEIEPDPNQLWRYAAPPEVIAVSPGIMTLTVELVAVI